MLCLCVPQTDAGCCAAVEIPDTPEFAPLHDPKQSAEVAIQEAREATTMEVDLAPTASLPDSPSEALVDGAATVVEDDASVKTLGLHPDLADDPAFHETVLRAQLGDPSTAARPVSKEELASNLASSEEISALLGTLVASGTPHPVDAAAPPAPVPTEQPNPGAPVSAAAIDPAALEQLRQFDASQVAYIVASSPDFQKLDLSAIGVALGGGVSAAPANGGRAQYHFGAPVQQPPGYAPAQVRPLFSCPPA